MATRSRLSRLRWSIAALTLSVLLASCSMASTSSDQIDSPSALNPAAAALVPPNIAASGVLRTATDPFAAPFTYRSPDGNFIGFDVELAGQIADALGLELAIEPVPFTALLPAVASGEADIAISGLFITDERLNNVDFVSYLSGGTSWLVQTGSEFDEPVVFKCGLRVGVVSGTFQATQDLPERSQDCREAGEAPLEIVTFASTPEGVEALLTFDLSAFVGDGPVVQWAAEQSKGRLQVEGSPYDPLEYGIAVSPSQPQLSLAIQEALTGLLTSGKYQQLTGKWGVDQGALENSRIRSSSTG